MEKKKVRVWGKINLYETSVVGIPAYPNAHMSANSFSLIKSLSEMSDELNQMKEINMQKDETPEVQPDAAPEESEDETPEAETPEETPEESADEESEESEEKSAISMDAIQEMVAKGIKDGLDSLTNEKGLVQGDMDNETMKKELAQKSMGELLNMQGLLTGVSK